jgi:hypothetical protein
MEQEKSDFIIDFAMLAAKNPTKQELLDFASKQGSIWAVQLAERYCRKYWRCYGDSNSNR